MIIAGFLISVASCSQIMAAEEGPTAGELKAAMTAAGIRTGAVFELSGKKYTLKNISVIKTGPETYTVSVSTTSHFKVGGLAP